MAEELGNIGSEVEIYAASETDTLIGNIAPQNALVTGGATWNSGLIFDVTALSYWLLGTLYTSAPTQVTLGAADPIDARIDIIAVDSTGLVFVIAGTPAPSPVKPEVDLSTYVEVTFVQVDAGAVIPDISVENIYIENAGGPAEWNASTNSGNLVTNSTNDPYQGTTSIEATNAITNNRVNLIKATPYTINLTSVLELKIKLKAVIGSNEQLKLRFRNGAVNVGIAVTIRNGRYGLDRTNITDYQTIAIPLSEFDVSGDVTELRITCKNIATTIGFFLDNVRIQEGFGISLGPVDAEDVTYTPNTPADWDTSPANVASALDELAASHAVWAPTAITLGDGVNDGATTGNNTGAGLYVSFDSGQDDQYLFNIGLERNGLPYDGTDIALAIMWQRFGGPAANSVKWELDYLFSDNGDDAYTDLDGTVALEVAIPGIPNQTLRTDTMPVISGPVGAKVLQLTLRRNGQGGGSDSYNGDAEVYGLNLTQ